MRVTADRCDARVTGVLMCVSGDRLFFAVNVVLNFHTTESLVSRISDVMICYCPYLSFYNNQLPM